MKRDILNDNHAIDNLLDKLNASKDPIEQKKLIDQLKGISNPSIQSKEINEQMIRLFNMEAWMEDRLPSLNIKEMETEFVRLDTLVKDGKASQEDKESHAELKAIMFQFITYCLEIINIMTSAIEQRSVRPLKKSLYLIENVINPLLDSRTSLNKKGGIK